MGRKEAPSPGGVMEWVQGVEQLDWVTRSIVGWCLVCFLPLEIKSSDFRERRRRDRPASAGSELFLFSSPNAETVAQVASTVVSY